MRKANMRNGVTKMVNIGDKIVVTDTDYPSGVPNGTVMTVSSYQFYPEDGYVHATVDGGDNFRWYMDNRRYKPYYSEPKLEDDSPTLEGVSPTLWKDMTPEEKGALLLAHHEGKTIEWNGIGGVTGEWTGWDNCDDDCLWDGSFKGGGFAYRIKPEVKRESRNLYIYKSDDDYCLTQVGTIDLIDGIPDPESIKITEV